MQNRHTLTAGPRDLPGQEITVPSDIPSLAGEGDYRRGMKRLFRTLMEASETGLKSVILLEQVSLTIKHFVPKKND